MKINRITLFHVLTIVGIVILLGVINHIPGTTLSGWDNLQTELNPVLGVKRAFFSVWQEYQSFGLVAGMAHAADLPRAMMVWIASFILPTSLIRYVLHFKLVAFGALGMYWLLRTSGLQGKKTHFALAGSIAYIFSFVSLQLLALPFEAFVFFYAFFPWEVGIFMKLLQSKHLDKKGLWSFIALLILGTPQWVAQQLFLVFIACLFLSGVHLAYIHHTKKRLVGLLVLIFAINSFWLFPQVYFLIDNGSVVWTNKINQLSTGDILYSNLARGTLNDFIRQEGFFYDRLSIDHNYLFHEWKAFRSIPIVPIGIYGSFCIALFGLFSKSKLKLGFIAVGLFVALALLINTFPFNAINELLRSHGFINQIFRSPFTKFAIPYALVFSFFFAHGLHVISSTFSFSYRNTRILFASLGIALMISISLPAFGGHYLIPDMQIKYPEDYEEVIEYFEGQDKNQRIALMPDYTFWGWFFHKWGYNGSGFIWYGIEQPIISRTFDVWSTQSESYFWEMKSALESEDLDRVTNVLDKYAVDFVIVDSSLEAVSSNIKALQFDRIFFMLDDSPLFTREYEGEHLTVYKYATRIPRKDFISSAKNLPSVSVESSIIDRDIGYMRHGTYSSVKFAETIYPFSSLFSQTRLAEKKWYVTFDESSLIFSAKLPEDLDDYEIVLPQYDYNEGTSIDNVELSFNDKVTVTADEKNVYVRIPLHMVPLPEMTEANTYPCGTSNNTDVNFEVLPSSVTTHATNQSAGCIGLSVPYVDQRFGYVLKINHTVNVGRAPFFALTDHTKSQSIIEDRLTSPEQLFVIPPHFMYGLGYSLNFQTDSYPSIPATNTIERPELYFVPFDILSNIRYERKNVQNTQPTFNDTSSFEVNKHSVYNYSIYVQNTSSLETLVFWQSFDQGWITINVKTLQRLPNHHRINNWANGWTIEPEMAQSNQPLHIIIFFWPQLLQYAGFGIMIITLLGIGFFIPQRH